MGEKIQYHTDLQVYQLAFDSAMLIFELTKSFPKEELYSLVDQIRRSSRSVCSNISEAWRKRRYRAAFCLSLNHAEAEAAETQVWLLFSKCCGYSDKKQVDELIKTYDNILGKIVNMIKFSDHWIL